MTLIGENRKYSNRTFQSVLFVHCLISGLGMNLGLHGKRLATSCLCHNMAKSILERNLMRKISGIIFKWIGGGMQTDFACSRVGSTHFWLMLTIQVVFRVSFLLKYFPCNFCYSSACFVNIKLQCSRLLQYYCVTKSTLVKLKGRN